MTPGPITLVGVWAHPDDETYLSAALMHRVSSAGGRVVVITATAGELGLDCGGGVRGAATIRREELRRALAEIGVDEFVVLDIPDGACDREDPRLRADQIGSLLDELEPDAVVTFGPDGVTAHPDHVAVSAWTLAACVDRRCDLLLATMSTSFHDRHRELHELIGLSMSDHGLPTIDDHLIDERVTPNPVELAAKLAAFAAHRSQTAPLRELVGDAAFESWWIDETFRRPTQHDVRWATDRCGRRESPASMRAPSR